MKEDIISVLLATTLFFAVATIILVVAMFIHIDLASSCLGRERVLLEHVVQNDNNQGGEE